MTKLKTNKEYNVAMDDVNSILCKGTVICHRKYGEGTVLSNNGEELMVDFPREGKTELGTEISVANRLVTVNDEENDKKLEAYRKCLKEGKSICHRVSYLEKELEPYAEYL